MTKMTVRSLIALYCLAPTVNARAGTCDSGSDGSDGVFNPLASVQIDLSLAATASWDTPSPVPGQGVYDPVQWAVVFKYSSITIPSGVTITFKNHPSGAPIVWLSQGDVLIEGSINLDGEAGHNLSQSPLPSRGGPGGFDGSVRGFGSSNSASGGYGPGGAGLTQNSTCGAGGGYGTDGESGACSVTPRGRSYGSVNIVPLVGGSGGGGSDISGTSGGGGGGAIIIAAGIEMVPATITLSGPSSSLTTRGGIGATIGSIGGGGGSGGAVRLVANTVTGAASSLNASGGFGPFGSADGGTGRIRIDAISLSGLAGSSSPNYTTDGLCAPVFPSTLPTLRVTQVDGLAVPADPAAGIMTTDVSIDDPNPVTIDIEATGIPAGTIVKVRVVPFRGIGDCLNTNNPPMSCNSSPLMDIGGGILTATATMTLPPGRTEIQLKANWTP